MRILFADHVGLPRVEEIATSPTVPIALAGELARKGHEVLWLSRPTKGEFAGLALDNFSDATDASLAEFREALRQRLDRIIAAQNPHLVHVHQVGVLGELVLESGVPYVQSVQPVDRSAARRDARLLPLWELALENAGRILVADESLAKEIRRDFPDRAENIVVLPELDLSSQIRPSPPTIAALITIYSEVVRRRCGDISP